MEILKVKNLKTYFNTDDGKSIAVDDVSFNLKKGEVLGIVGESGCGKSVTALSILRLHSPNAVIDSGEIIYNGKNLLDMPENEIRKIRGNKISMIFQEPMTSLNPVYKCGNQLIEVYKTHKNISHKDAYGLSIDMMKKTGINSPEKRMSEYPHQLSGGLRQRVMIAMALACEPEILIADEPTTALDVTIQAQILNLLADLQQELGMSIILITHDMGVVAQNCTRVIVMYASKIVEEASTSEIFNNPMHPYTQGLLRAIPDINKKTNKLYTIEGTVPSSYNYPEGCRFYDRCEYAKDECINYDYEKFQISDTHFINCINYKINDIKSK